MQQSGFFEEVPQLKEELRALVQPLAKHRLFVGGSSWKYQGWLGLLYTPDRYKVRGKFSEKAFATDCLREYAEVFSTVSVDAGYYQFPRVGLLERMAAQVPADFRFSFKVTDEITMRRFPVLPRYGTRGGLINPHFLNADLFLTQFLAPCAAIRDSMGILIFEFAAWQRTDDRARAYFVEALDVFFNQLPRTWQYGVEIRNPEFLSVEYFAVLRKHAVTHVVNHWERMPPAGEQLAWAGSRTTDFFAARFLLKPGRPYARAVEQFAPYREMKDPDAAGRAAARKLVAEARFPLPRPSYLFVNNRWEGNSLWTLRAVLGKDSAE